MDKEQTLNDLMNTGVSAALIGGFALSTLHEEPVVENNWLDILIYMFSFIAVHASTCACLTSAMLYRSANRVREDDIAEWARRNAFMLKLPWAKFVMGCSTYITSVIFLSYRALGNPDLAGFKYLALAIGIMSMSTVIMTGVSVSTTSKRTPTTGSGERPPAGRGQQRSLDPYET